MKMRRDKRRSGKDKYGAHPNTLRSFARPGPTFRHMDPGSPDVARTQVPTKKRGR